MINEKLDNPSKANSKTLPKEPVRMGRPIGNYTNATGSVIIEYRVRKKLSQKELGELLGGKSHTSIQKYEQGERMPKGLVLKELNRLLREEGLPELKSE